MNSGLYFIVAVRRSLGSAAVRSIVIVVIGALLLNAMYGLQAAMIMVIVLIATMANLVGGLRSGGSDG